MRSFDAGWAGPNHLPARLSCRPTFIGDHCLHSQNLPDGPQRWRPRNSRSLARSDLHSTRSGLLVQPVTKSKGLGMGRKHILVQSLFRQTSDHLHPTHVLVILGSFALGEEGFDLGELASQFLPSPRIWGERYA